MRSICAFCSMAHRCASLSFRLSAWASSSTKASVADSGAAAAASGTPGSRVLAATAGRGRVPTSSAAVAAAAEAEAELPEPRWPGAFAKRPTRGGASSKLMSPKRGGGTKSSGPCDDWLGAAAGGTLLEAEEEVPGVNPRGVAPKSPGDEGTAIFLFFGASDNLGRRPSRKLCFFSLLASSTLFCLIHSFSRSIKTECMASTSSM
mmetsp:Transcript_44347/g.96508  ORF Transcript_44347/g.96508 Transcript_44347/m.96508 type:complete len:205 (-) Transcript_44347:1382-1996(-)